MIKHFQRFCLLVFCSLVFNQIIAQPFFKSTPDAVKWVDSSFATLTPEQKIAQLMVIRAHSNLGPEHIAEVTGLINKYNIGGLCFFQGGPVRQATLTNYYQSIAKTPLMICIDGEWGLSMRLDSILPLPRQMFLGSLPDAKLIYEYGKVVGEQCKRIGIHVNYAPVVDVNNNPLNPVINDRSFGEDKYKVALYGIEYMKGMQDVGVMATAKHFPGHGDVSVDSHYDLPIINKSKAALDSLELYPFREMIKAGVGSMMVAHLYIPSIDTTPNRATSLSYNNVTNLLRNELGFKGITFTDALEMKGVSKFYPGAEASLQSLIAGNDMLCLPGDIPGSISKIINAIDSGKLSWTDIDARVKKVLLAKYHLGLNKPSQIDTANLVTDLNAQTDALKQKMAAYAVTLVKKTDDDLFPLNKKKNIAYVTINTATAKDANAQKNTNLISTLMQTQLKADTYFWTNKDSASIDSFISILKNKYDVVVTALHSYNRRPANNFNISNAAIRLVKTINESTPSITIAFGNPYAIANFPEVKNLIALYEDDDITQAAAFAFLKGETEAKGKLPVSVNAELPYGTGNTFNHYFAMSTPEEQGMRSDELNRIDSVVNNAMNAGAIPGSVVLVAKNGKVVFHRAYGKTSFDSSAASVNTATVYDLASVTKTSATTLAVMKLYEENKLELNKTIADYLPYTSGTDKGALKIIDILAHKAGLVAYIPFYKSTIDTAGVPDSRLYRNNYSDSFSVQVAENLYLRNDYQDTLMTKILASKLGAANKYVYSDNDFIFLGKIVEAITGQSLDHYVRNNFYIPMNMVSTTFKPLEHFPVNQIAPTEREKIFRRQQLQGFVHDPGAAMFGGVAGHAGLFSNAYDLAQLYQMFLNKGELNGKRYLKASTIKKFTAYNDKKLSRRGLGFDKTEPDKKKQKEEPYPSKFASTETFGHTGFTGTCVWVDPKYDLIYIFLSNRVNAAPQNVNKLLNMKVRGAIHDIIYQSIAKEKE